MWTTRGSANHSLKNDGIVYSDRSIKYFFGSIGTRELRGNGINDSSRLFEQLLPRVRFIVNSTYGTYIFTDTSHAFPDGSSLYTHKRNRRDNRDEREDYVFFANVLRAIDPGRPASFGGRVDFGETRLARNETRGF